MAIINQSIILLKHHVNLPSQGFRSVSLDLHQCQQSNEDPSTDEDPSLQIESFAMVNLRGVSTKLYFVLNFLPILS